MSKQPSKKPTKKKPAKSTAMRTTAWVMKLPESLLANAKVSAPLGGPVRNLEASVSETCDNANALMAAVQPPAVAILADVAAVTGIVRAVVTRFLGPLVQKAEGKP